MNSNATKSGQKRLNPTTGKPFQRGEKNEAGLLFCYYKKERVGADGYFKEWWATQEAFDQYKAKNRVVATRRNGKAAAFIKKTKLERGCMDCGYCKNSAALDFDHRPGVDKIFELAVGCSRSLDAIKAEMAKCDVVCANCHRIRTVNRLAPDGCEPSQFSTGE